MPNEPNVTIGMILFPDLTQLDLTGPYEVFSRVPGVKIHLIAESTEPLRSDSGLLLQPDTTYDQAPQLDILMVPGGPGVGPMMSNQPLLRFLRDQSKQARFVTSVCTGSLLLGASGLLKGYKATTHWLSMDLLPLFGAIPVDARIVRDGNRITGGGVTAGIDFGLTVAAELVGEPIASEIELAMEYDPDPPFKSGSPKIARKEFVSEFRARRAEWLARRRQLAEEAAARMTD